MTLHLEFGLQPTSASCQGSSPNLLLVEHLQDLFIATEASVEQCRCMNQRKWENQNSISTYVSDSKKIFLSCRHPTKIPSPHRLPPTIKWDQDGGARAGKIDDGFFQTPPQPAFKGHWWYLFDTISFWHCSEAKTSKCGVGGRKKQHATCNFFETLTKAFHYFFFYVVWFVFDINEIIVLTVLIVYWSSLSLIGAASYVPILQARCPSSTIESVALSCHSLISNACLHNTPQHVCMCS